MALGAGGKNRGCTLRRWPTIIVEFTSAARAISERNTRRRLAKFAVSCKGAKSGRHTSRKHCPASADKLFSPQNIWRRHTNMFAPPGAYALRTKCKSDLAAWAHTFGDSKRRTWCRTSLYSANRLETRFHWRRW